MKDTYVHMFYTFSIVNISKHIKSGKNEVRQIDKQMNKKMVSLEK